MYISIHLIISENQLYINYKDIRYLPDAGYCYVLFYLIKVYIYHGLSLY